MNFSNIYVDREAVLRLAGLVSVHHKNCTKNDCVCGTLVKEAGKDVESALEENTRIFSDQSTLPRQFKENFTISVVKMLIEDISLRYGKNNTITALTAEASFYYFANHYHALEQIINLETRKPSLLMRQRIYNLKRVIANGMANGAEENSDPESTLASIDYLGHYHKFLNEMEEATDLTIKFWIILQQEIPLANKLNELGKSLCKCKYQIMQTVQDISDISSNHIEFLIKYGLFTKYIMHDTVTSDQIYKKILNITYSSKHYSLSTSAFSLFRGDASVMLIIASIDNANAATICEVNTEVEHLLGYTREDILGYSITNIMPPGIAQRHPEFVQNFFRTMKAHCINTPRFKFIKSKDGLYIPCYSLKKIVPRLNEGLQVALFLRVDNRITPHTSSKKELTENKVN